jgi:hypothetical protein
VSIRAQPEMDEIENRRRSGELLQAFGILLGG